MNNRTEILLSINIEALERRREQCEESLRAGDMQVVTSVDGYWESLELEIQSVLHQVPEEEEQFNPESQEIQGESIIHFCELASHHMEAIRSMYERLSQMQGTDQDAVTEEHLLEMHQARLDLFQAYIASSGIMHCVPENDVALERLETLLSPNGLEDQEDSAVELSEAEQWNQFYWRVAKGAAKGGFIVATVVASSYVPPLFLIQGSMLSSITTYSAVYAVTNGVQTVACNAIDGEELTSGLGKSMAQGAICGSVAAGVSGIAGVMSKTAKKADATTDLLKKLLEKNEGRVTASKMSMAQTAAVQAKAGVARKVTKTAISAAIFAKSSSAGDAAGRLFRARQAFGGALRSHRGASMRPGGLCCSSAAFHHQQRGARAASNLPGVQQAMA